MFGLSADRLADRCQSGKKHRVKVGSEAGQDIISRRTKFGRICRLTVDSAPVWKWHGRLARGPKKPPDMGKMPMPLCWPAENHRQSGDAPRVF
jgi:hypothetical protein